MQLCKEGNLDINTMVGSVNENNNNITVCVKYEDVSS